MPLTNEQREQVRGAYRAFIQKRFENLRGLSLDNLNINAFLIRLLSHELGLNDARSIVRWLVQQRFERGTVTSFGIFLQNVAKLFSEGTGVEGADIMKTDENGVRWYIEVKSGPNAIPKTQANQVSTLLQSARRRDPGSSVLFGMCYGRPDQVSSIVQNYIGRHGGVDWLAGRAFWEFVSGDANCVEELYELASEVGENYRSGDGRTIRQCLDAKIDELAREYQDKYGDRGDEMWRRLLQENT